MTSELQLFHNQVTSTSVDYFFVIVSPMRADVDAENLPVFTWKLRELYVQGVPDERDVANDGQVYGTFQW